MTDLLPGYVHGSTWQQYVPASRQRDRFRQQLWCATAAAGTAERGRSSGYTGSTSPGNASPHGANDTVNTNEDAALTINASTLLANDTDANGDALSITGVANGQHGTAVLNSNGSVTYTPTANFNGQDTFTYTVSDGHGGSGSATVTVNVAPVPDAPVAKNNSLVAQSGVATVLNVLANDTDADGDKLSIVSVSNPGHGTVVINSDNTLTYTPATGFTGADAFTYTINDGTGRTATATASVAVSNTPTAVIEVNVSGDQYNGDPQFRLIVDGQQVGDIQTVTANHSAGESQTVDFTVNAPFSEVKVEFVNDLYGGTPDTDRNLDVNWISINGVQLTPDQALYDRYGWDDIPGQSNVDYPGALVFDVSGRTDLFGTTANAAPVLHNDTAATNEDTPVTINVLANDSDPNGDTLTVTGASATNGTVKVNTDGTLTYTPKANFNGNDAISYTVSDGKGGSATASVAVAVAAVNDAPVAQNDTATTHSPVTINVLANDTDVDGDTLTVTSASAPHGTTTINNDQTVTYVPNDGVQRPGHAHLQDLRRARRHRYRDRGNHGAGGRRAGVAQRHGGDERGHAGHHQRAGE